MAGGGFFSATHGLGRFLPERRIYVRSDSHTRYINLTTGTQLALAFTASVFLSWSAFTTTTFLMHAVDGRTMENQLETTREAYEIQIAALREQQRAVEEELNRSNARGDTVTAELSKKQRKLVEAAAQLRVAEAELAGVRGEFAVLVADRQTAQTEISSLHDKIADLQLAMTDAVQAEAAMGATFGMLSDSMIELIDERDTAKSNVEVLDRRVAALEQEIGAREDNHEYLLAQLENATKTSLDALDGLFVGSNVNLDAILKQAERDYTGRGGGPIDEEANAAGGGTAPDQRLAALFDDMERMSLLRVAVDRLPFGTPTRGARLTSGFGPRRDPYRRRHRMHSGIDFAAPKGTPIYSTAEGVVTYSGRQRGYGIVVKIRHAFGFETVYAHLSKSRVKVGERVQRGTRIADMGSTGRSTGTHLHYEIRIDGNAVNPKKFIKAPRDVL